VQGLANGAFSTQYSINRRFQRASTYQHKGSIILKASKESYKVTIKQVPKITAESGTVLLEDTLYCLAELHQKLRELLLETFGTTED